MLSIRRQNRDMGGFIVSGALFKGWRSHYSKVLDNRTMGGREASLTSWVEDYPRLSLGIPATVHIRAIAA